MSTSASTNAAPTEHSDGTWTIDSDHSYIGFTIRHLMVSKIRGQFERVSGEIVTGDRIEDSTAEAVIDVNSIHTNSDDRDTHLRSADFFDAENYPTITFTSTRFRASADTLCVDGQLTMRGVTREITLTSGPPSIGGPNPEGFTVIAFSATGELSRGEFGMDFNVPMNAGGFMLGEKVELVLQIEALRTPDSGPTSQNPVGR